MELYERLSSIFKDDPVPTYHAAGCIVVRGDEILVIQTDKGYELPKGHIEIGESPEDAALRETYEETGIRCKVIGDPLEVNCGHKSMMFYPARCVIGNPRPTADAEESIYYAGWISIKKVLKSMKKRRFYQYGLIKNLLSRI